MPHEIDDGGYPRSLGYLYDDPLAIASQTSLNHWRLALLMQGRPFLALPDNYTDPDIAPSLDQDGVGACVAFAAEQIKNAQEHKEWGQWLFKTPDAFKCYDWLKHGHGTFPGDGIPNVEGSWPEAVWKLAKMEGLPHGTSVKKITAYYAANLASASDWELIKQAIYQLGPVNVATPWHSNMMPGPPGPSYIMPTPNGNVVGGHSFTIAGWRVINGIEYAVCLNSWGQSWTDKFGTFLIRVSWLTGTTLGPQIIWKTTDQRDAPYPPPPPPEAIMLVLYDKVARLVDSAVGKTLYRADGVTALVNISSGALNLASPAAYKNATGVLYYSVVVTSGGVPQLAWLKAADCFNVRVQSPTDPKADFNAGVAAAATAALAAKKV